MFVGHRRRREGYIDSLMVHVDPVFRAVDFE